MLVKEFMSYVKEANNAKVNETLKKGYVALAAQYLADVYEDMASEAYAKRTIRPWHVDAPSKEIEEEYWKISLDLRRAIIKA